MAQQYLFLPFDHRASFEKGLFGIEGRPPTKEEVEKLRKVKQVIFEAVKIALQRGVPKDRLAVLTDEFYGIEVIKQAQKIGIMTAMPVEKSGQDVFDFDAGAKYKDHIKKVNATFTKVLVRYNPENKDDNLIQLKRLRELNDFLVKEKRKLLFELLVPPTRAHADKYGGAYDSELRPKLMIRAIKEIQDAGIRPHIWKIEGVDKQSDMKVIVKLVKSVDRNVVVIVLGRGESEENVKRWLSAAAGIEGVEGFAVGRTVFMDPLKRMVAGKLNEAEAASAIADNYLRLVALWERFKKG